MCFAYLFTVLTLFAMSVVSDFRMRQGLADTCERHFKLKAYLKDDCVCLFGQSIDLIGFMTLIICRAFCGQELTNRTPHLPQTLSPAWR